MLGNKIFFAIVAFLCFAAFSMAESNDSPQKKCACVEKFGFCDCPKNETCPCMQQFNHCECHSHPKENAQLQNNSQTPCACVQKFGSCECPKEGACPCIGQQGQCRCVSHNHLISKGQLSCPYQNCQFENLETNDFPEENCFGLNFECDTCEGPCQTLPLPQHQFYIGPEIYFAHRDKAGRDKRTKQNGWMFGGRAGYDRIKRCRIYWGVDGLYANGTLKSHKSHGTKVKIDFTDENIEGRLGYTFQKKTGWMPTFVPYVGYGYYRETSKFKRPSPILFKQRVTFDYVAAGFLSQLYVHPLWIAGVNFKARFLFNSECKISDDPDYEDFTQNIEHKVQYRVELPVTYRLKCWCDRLAVSLVPFYEYRHYGEHINFPFDFKDVRFNFYGFDLRLMYMF